MPDASRCRPRSEQNSTGSSRRSIAIRCRCCCCGPDDFALDASRAFMRDGEAQPRRRAGLRHRRSPAGRTLVAEPARAPSGGCWPRWSRGRWRRNGTARRSTTSPTSAGRPATACGPTSPTAEQNFHTDNSYNHVPPHYVGLMCLRTAMEGGVSGIVSFATAHEEMRRRHPDLLPRLYPAVLLRPASASTRRTTS